MLGVRTMIIGEDGSEVVASEDVRVYHPAERRGEEVPANRVAGLLRRNRTFRAEHGKAVLTFGPSRRLAAFRDAPVDVLMPPGNAERDPLVQFLHIGALGHRVHRA